MKFETEYSLQEWRDIRSQHIAENGDGYSTLGTDAKNIIVRLDRIITLLEDELKSVENHRIIVYTDGSWKPVAKTNAWEYEADPDY
ncbi:hypothetical protein ABK046_48545, partial [Streptomyces caeruleatus]